METGKFSAEIIDSDSDHTSTLIFLHGLGDTGIGCIRWLNLKNVVPNHCKVICPNASRKPVTINDGYIMPSWFDVFGFKPDSRQDDVGIKAASEELTAIIDSELQSGISADRIVIGGISQGGAVALFNALTCPTKKYAGVVLLSTWLASHSSYETGDNIVSCDKDLPVLQCHGEKDTLVSLEMGHIVKQFLRDHGMTKLEFIKYPDLGHTICRDEMKDVEDFIARILDD